MRLFAHFDFFFRINSQAWRVFFHTFTEVPLTLMTGTSEHISIVWKTKLAVYFYLVVESARLNETFGYVRHPTPAGSWASALLLWRTVSSADAEWVALGEIKKECAVFPANVCQGLWNRGSTSQPNRGFVSLADRGICVVHTSDSSTSWGIPSSVSAVAGSRSVLCPLPTMCALHLH